MAGGERGVRGGIMLDVAIEIRCDALVRGGRKED